MLTARRALREFADIAWLDVSVKMVYLIATQAHI